MALPAFGGDRCQTPGGLNKAAQGTELARQKLLTRQHGLRLQSKQLLSTQLASKLGALMCRSNSPLAPLPQAALKDGNESHSQLFVDDQSTQLGRLAASFPHLRCLQGHVGAHLNWKSSVVRVAVVILVAAQDDSFFQAIMAKTNLESAGAVGEHCWHLMLCTSARVSPLTYSAVVATRYVEMPEALVYRPICTRRQSNLPTGFHTVLWYPGQWKNGATYSYAVCCVLSTLLSHHNWEASANESLYLMCNNLEDVRTLENDDNVWNSQSQVRCGTVASSASTTAKVAAVIQRGGVISVRFIHQHGLGRRLCWQIHCLPNSFQVIHISDATSFRAKGLRFVAPRCHCPPP